MSAIDTTFERVFEEMRAERQELRAEMRELRGELRAEIAALNAALSERLNQVDERLNHLDERLGRIGFWAAGILATGLIALVATQLKGRLSRESASRPSRAPLPSRPRRRTGARG